MAKLLVVDDEPINLDIIADCLGDQHELSFAHDGLEAWQLLKSEPSLFDGVILDRMMPRMDGIDVLRRIKADARFKDVPVIMQSAADSSEQVAEGLAAGAWYYLAKPYSAKALRSIVAAALDDRRNRRELARLGSEMMHVMGLTQQATFRFRLLDDVSTLASVLAQMCPNAETVSMGLSELMLNAVEHGNLGIDYGEKGRLIEAGTWQEEVERRLADPLLAERFALVEFERTSERLRFTISDQGHGFEWHSYLDLDPARAFDSHGRGIAMARYLAFSSLEYQGVGNQVTVTVPLAADDEAGEV
jgi:CheY-like chemotaxis protein